MRDEVERLRKEREHLIEAADFLRLEVVRLQTAIKEALDGVFKGDVEGVIEILEAASAGGKGTGYGRVSRQELDRMLASGEAHVVQQRHDPM